MIIAVSDLHLGYEECNAGDIDRFLASPIVTSLTNSDHFVLVGDILDFWRANSITALTKNEPVVRKMLDLQHKTNLHYVVGNHDYLMWRFGERAGFPEYRPFRVHRSVQLNDGGKSFFFVHGYELEVLASLWPLSLEDYETIAYRLCYQRTWIGKLLSALWGWPRRLLKSRGGAASMVKIMQPPEDRKLELDKVDDLARKGLAHVIYGLADNENLVFGHTHRPFSPSNFAVNLGSWVSDSPDHDTYLVIDDGQMKLERFK